MKIIRAILLSLLLSCSVLPDTAAQCPMCRMSVESNLKNGGTTGKGLNRGILYMLIMPYLLVGTIGYVWWRNKRQDEEEFELN
jgi:hypothetical protein